jgi:hypothetical protein
MSAGLTSNRRRYGFAEVWHKDCPLEEIIMRTQILVVTIL